MIVGRCIYNMRVLLIDVNCKKGSTGKIVYDLYKENINRGHSSAICYGRGPVINEPNIFKFGIDLETYIHALLTRLTGFTGVFSPFSTRRLIKFIDDYKPDVVHIHELHAYFVNIDPVIKYLKKKKIKTIWTFHCEFMYTGKCGYSYDCNKWKNKCGKCSKVKEYPASLFFDFTKVMFDWKKRLFADFYNLKIVTPSHWLAERVRHSFLKDKEIQVIHNGIDTVNVFHPRSFKHLLKKHNLGDEKIVLAVAPNLMEERKGGKWVLELAKRCINENVKFILIGIDDLNSSFDHNIIALGRTSNQIELAEYYSMADVFVICSKKENFPTTCIESLCCGTPVLGFDEGGTKETAPNNYGSFVKYGDIDELYNKLKLILYGKKIIASKEDCATFGKENYDKAIMAKKYMNIYET